MKGPRIQTAACMLAAKARHPEPYFSYLGLKLGMDMDGPDRSPGR
jgi:hypothetical protein